MESELFDHCVTDKAYSIRSSKVASRIIHFSLKYRTRLKYQRLARYDFAILRSICSSRSPCNKTRPRRCIAWVAWC